MNGKQTRKIFSESEHTMLNAILAGEDPEIVADNNGTSVSDLVTLKERLLATVLDETAGQVTLANISRNGPCPCGSGKKYKKCCLGTDRDPANVKNKQFQPDIFDETVDHEREKKISAIVQEGFRLFSLGLYCDVMLLAHETLDLHPHEDRLHDLLQITLLYAGYPEKAAAICRKRWLLALKDRDFVREHGYQPREHDEKSPSAPGFPPLGWLQKYWTARQATDWRKVPRTNDRTGEIQKLIDELLTANDMERFPQTREEGIHVRREALSGTIEQLALFGDDVLPWLADLSWRYSWVCMLVPDILTLIDTEKAIRMLIDIIMFQIPFASETSMKYLEMKGERIIPNIRAAFAIDKEFDPIKTGIISVLGNLRTAPSYAILINLLEHPERHIVNWTAGALAIFGDLAALSKLLAVREHMGSEPRLDWAIEQLEKKHLASK